MTTNTAAGPPPSDKPAASGRVEELDNLMQVTRPRGWLAFGVLSAILVAVLVWSVAGSFPVEASGQGILVRPPGIYRVQAQQAGTIVELPITIGDTIQKGQLLARVQTSAAATQEIRSEEDGRVIAVVAAPFQFVTAGTRLASLEPLTDALEAVIFVPAEQGKSVRPGMKTKLSASGVPGGLRGTVRDVAAFPASPARIDVIVQNDAFNQLVTAGGPVYEVHVAVDSSSASSGTVCTAFITLQQRRPIRLIFPESEPR